MDWKEIERGKREEKKESAHEEIKRHFI